MAFSSAGLTQSSTTLHGAVGKADADRLAFRQARFARGRALQPGDDLGAVGKVRWQCVSVPK